MILAWVTGLAALLPAAPLIITTSRFQAETDLGDLVSLRDAIGVVLVTNLASSHGLVLHRVDNDHKAGLDAGPAVWDGTGTAERTLTNFSTLPGATARCSYAIDSASGDLVISQSCTSPVAGVWGVEWFIANIPLEFNIIVPGLSGVKLTRSSGGGLTTQSFDYPMAWEAQLVIVEGNDRGFYVWSDDRVARFKRLTVLRTTQGWQLGFASVNHAPFETLQRCDSVPWRLNVYEGDWRAPARRYRGWAAAAFAQSPLEGQEPAWIRDIRCCAIMGTDIGIVEGLTNHLDPTQTLLYIYDWRASGYDRDYPTYDNPVPQLAGLVERAHALGFRVMLHVNYFGCDPLNALYPQFEPYQVRSPWGTHEREWWNWEAASPPIKFAYINPACSAWRRLFVERMRALCDSTRADALHLDQTLCIYNDQNGLIEGMTMAEGNLALHRELRAALPHIALSGEGLNEITLRHETFAQRHAAAGIANLPAGARVNRAGLEISHPISSFLFRPYTILYGYLGYPEPADGQLYAAWNEAYQHWGVIPTLKPHRQDYTSVAEFTRQFFDEVHAFQQGRIDPDLDGPWPAEVFFPFKTADGQPCARTVDRCLICAGREISRTITRVREVQLPGLIPGASQYDRERAFGLAPDRWYPYFPEPRDLARLHLEQMPPGFDNTAVAETAGLGQVSVPPPSDVAVNLLDLLDTAICSSEPAGGVALELIGPLNGPHGSQFYRDGDTIVAHPPWRSGVGTVSARYSVDLPVAETLRFESAVALDAGAVAPGRSDGVTFSVTASGQDHSLSNSVHTASAELRALDLDLRSLGGERVVLLLQVHPGPALDPSYDWARWHNPRIKRSLPPTQAELVPVSSNRWSIALAGTNEIDLAGMTNRFPIPATLPGEFFLLAPKPGGVTLPLSLSSLPLHKFFFLQPNLLVADALYAGAEWRDGTIGGQSRPGLFMHPPNFGRTEAVFPLKLPPQPALFQASIGILDGSFSNGALFLVKVNGTEVARMQKRPGSRSDLAVDLAPWRGRTIVLTLAVDSAGDYTYDWCHWGTPMLRTAPRLGQLTRQPGGMVDIPLLDAVGLPWRLERSTDLVSWISLLQTNPSSNMIICTDDSPALRSFYRAAWP